MAEDGTAVDVVELLDRYTCAILAATSERPTSAKQIRETADIAGSTLYRRLPRLVERGLLTEDTRIDTDGNHHQVYEANIEQLTFDVDDGNVTISVSLADESEPLVTTWEGDG